MKCINSYYLHSHSSRIFKSSKALKFEDLLNFSIRTFVFKYINSLSIDINYLLCQFSLMFYIFLILSCYINACVVYKLYHGFLYELDEVRPENFE